jgi:formylglycine-generating enzyme
MIYFALGVAVGSLHSGMVWIPGGTFKMGSNSGLSDESPAHSVTLSGFWIDKYEVTNRQFEGFVKATGYKTIAERPLNPKDFPGVPKSKLVPGALVFTAGKGWDYIAGASWRHPSGPKSTLKNKMEHPVVQVAWDDAIAYAKWAGRTLPTEAQYEFAARGGKAYAEYPWGSEPPSTKRPQANIWQGNFPVKNDNTDGFASTSPVGTFKPNGFGLYDIGGNVWEWCLDWYRPDAYTRSEKVNPKGPRSSYDPDEPNMPKHVVRGGSFLCADCYCKGYRLTARMKSSADTGLCHTGFRCVSNSK